MSYFVTGKENFSTITAAAGLFPNLFCHDEAGNFSYIFSGVNAIFD
jgi:hypothetical protein